MLIFIYILLAFPINLLSFGVSCVTQDVYWRNYVRGDIPCDAYQGAPGRYIGQFNHNSYDLVATIYAESGVAIATYGTTIKVEKDIKILCSPDQSKLYWEYVDFNKAHDLQLQHAVKGGFQEIAHNQLFVGKALHEGEWRIGKILGFDTTVKGLWVWGQDGKHFNFRQFFILKYNMTGDCGKQCHSDNII